MPAFVTRDVRSALSAVVTVNSVRKTVYASAVTIPA